MGGTCSNELGAARGQVSDGVRVIIARLLWWIAHVTWSDFQSGQGPIRGVPRIVAALGILEYPLRLARTQAAESNVSRETKAPAHGAGHEWPAERIP